MTGPDEPDLESRELWDELLDDVPLDVLIAEMRRLITEDLDEPAAGNDA